MKFIKIFFLLLLCFSMTTCRKDKVSKIMTVNGTVMNIYSGTSVPGLKVVFQSIYDRTTGGFYFPSPRKGKYSSTLKETTTDANGNFSFKDVEIYSDGDYRYNVFTSSPYADQTSGAPYNDASTSIDKGNLAANIVLEVKPAIASFNIKMIPSANIIYPDTITIKCKPKYPIDPNTYSNKTITSSLLKTGNPITALYHDPMGWWYININKTKNSINTVIKDSIYLDFNSSTTYTLSF